MAQFEAFYDTETTGPNPTFDQVLQKAAILTDDDFAPIESFDVRSRIARWMVPTPGALKVTHLDPNEIARAPHSAFEFARLMHATFTNWASRGPIAFSGWNTLSYDEEIVRRMFYMNLLDPYITSGKGKCRVDYLLMTRALAARNPDILTIPRHAHNGKANFKLENIATANGFTGHNAHDALGDVWATIHMARLIRDLDPSLFGHVRAMGSANDAMSFVEDEKIFRLLGGPMIEPGILDVCLIATDPGNPKSKKAWNLAVDPTPFLEMSTEEILAAMKKSGTPFRGVKCHKSPLVFPIGWEFLRHASKTDAPTPDLIDARSKLVMENTGFRQRVAEAMRLQTEGYEPNVHLEEKIYDGFPSWADKDAMKAFHNAATWERRLVIARAFEKTELQQIGVRLVWANAPECLSEQHRTAIDAHVGATRFGLLTGQPWTTVGSFMEELDEWDVKLPGDPELATIRAWALATFPEAAKWVPKPKAEEGAADPALDGGPTVSTDHVDPPAPEPKPTPAAPAPVPAGPAPHFLDGID